MSQTINVARADLEWAVTAFETAVRAHKDAEAVLADRRTKLAKAIWEATEPAPEPAPEPRP